MVAGRGGGPAAARIGRHQLAPAFIVIRNPLTWCVWAIAAFSIAFMDRNPVLQLLTLLVILNAWLPYHRRSAGVPWKFGLALALVPVLFSVALSRFGSHVIVRLPAFPIIGGAWSWEAVAYGASTGLALIMTVLVFAVLQGTVRSAELIGLLPRALYRAGTAFALSLAMAPKAISSYHAIREARLLRGQRSGWRSASGLLLPLLLTTLEHALQYAESLDARGYGSRRRSRYHPLGWSAADALVMTTSLAALIVNLLALPSAYDPYLGLAPAFPAAANLLAVGLLATPAVLALVFGEHATNRG
jgi:energy-coupling factor transport system permease protein